MTRPNPKSTAIAMVRDLRRVRDEMAENQASFDEQVAELRDWLDEQQEALAERAGKLEAQLRLWLEGRIADDPDRKRSEKLPGGDLVLRKLPAKVDIVDEARLLELVKAAWPDAVHVPTPPPPKPRVPVAKIKSLLDAGVLKVDGDPEQVGEHKLIVVDTDEVLDGVLWTVQPEKFEVKTEETNR